MITKTTGKGRIPPHNIEAEQSILGSMLQDKEAIDKAEEVLNSNGQDFYHDIHGKIYKTMIELYRQSIPVDGVTVADKFVNSQLLNPLGGDSYLAELIELTPTTANVSHYIKIVKDKAGLRSIIETCSNMAEKGYKGEDLDGVLDEFQQASLAIKGVSVSNYQSISDISTGMLEELLKGGYTGIPAGMTDLDNLTGGFQRGTLIAICARPSQGKTTFAMDVAYRQAEAGYSVGIFQLETSKNDMTKNAVARLTEINSMKFRTNKLTDADWSLIREKTKEFETLNLIIDDQTSCIDDIITQIRKMYKDLAIDTVFIDYLGLIISRGKQENRNLELGSFTRRLKLLAKELNIAIIILCQLNRGLEGREDKRPRLSDIRDSGEIEQDIDVCIMLYWEGKYNPKVLTTDRKDRTEIAVNKHRNGPIGEIEMEFRKQISKFEAVWEEKR